MSKIPLQILGSKRPQLFSELGEDSLQNLLNYAITQEHGPNHILVQQGDTPNGLYLVLEGQVRTNFNWRRIGGGWLLVIEFFGYWLFSYLLLSFF